MERQDQDQEVDQALQQHYPHEALLEEHEQYQEVAQPMLQQEPRESRPPLRKLEHVRVAAEVCGGPIWK